MNQLRVLHGVTGAANQPATVSRLQRQLGADARCLTISVGGFGYPADIELDPGPDAQATFGEFLAGAVEEYDVFHFYFRSFFFFDARNNAFPSGLDLLALRAAGKTVVVHFRGSEVREANRFRAYSPYHYVDENPSGIFTKFSDPSLTQRVGYIRSVANIVLVPDEELQSYVPGSEIVRRAIDLDRFEFSAPPANPRPLVVHAPSRRVVKGTDSVLHAVDELRAEGLDFDFRLIEGLSHDEATAVYRDADIVIDQLRIGWFGVFALETMALGKCVLAYVRDDLRHHLSDEPPLLPTTPDGLTGDLRKAITDPTLRAELGRRGRAYVEEHHDATRIAADLLELYRRPDVVDHRVDVEGVMRFLLAQRDDTKGVYRKKFERRAGADSPLRRTRRRARQFRDVWRVRGARVALRRTSNVVRRWV